MESGKGGGGEGLLCTSPQLSFETIGPLPGNYLRKYISIVVST